MNREQLKRLASEWVRMAKNDIRDKVISFIEEVDTTQRELAYHLAMSEDELQQIIDGNGEITITTFAKLLIATGNALEIKPIEATPIGCYENIPFEPQHVIRPNVFSRQSTTDARPMFTRSNTTNQQPTQGHFANRMGRRDIPVEGEDDVLNCPQQPTRGRFANTSANPQQPTQGHFMEVPRFSFDDEELANTHEGTNRQIPRDEHGRFIPRNNSPFAGKSVNELSKIIKERLWDSEIDLSTATKEDLVKFLDEKNRRMEEVKRMRNIEEDPKVVEFKNKLKKRFEDNPHLREWVKNFVGDLG